MHKSEYRYSFVTHSSSNKEYKTSRLTEITVFNMLLLI